ncbi:MAG: hypothetical protein JSR42_03985 [Proteobacteria bacterium]|nr:hypothetical protein [Pseudomonadota bacterium]
MRLLIYGSREFASTVADLVRHCGYEVAGMVDDFNIGAGIVGNLDAAAKIFPPGEYGFAVAIGYSNIPARWQAWERIRAAGYRAPALVHPRAYVADNAVIGEGCMVMAGAVVDVRAQLGELVVVWPGACINHDVAVGKNTFISPNATLCGSVVIGADTFIGAASSVADHSHVPASSFIKMNSVFKDNRQ